MRLLLGSFTLFFSMLFWVSHPQNSIEPAVALEEPSGKEVYFLRVDCDNADRFRKCIDFLHTAGSKKAFLRESKCQAHLDPIGSTAAFTIVKLHKPTDTYLYT